MSIIFRELFLNPPCLISKFASENEYSSLAILRKTGNKARLRRGESEAGGRDEQREILLFNGRKKGVAKRKESKSAAWW